MVNCLQCQLYLRSLCHGVITQLDIKLEYYCKICHLLPSLKDWRLYLVGIEIQYYWNHMNFAIEIKASITALHPNIYNNEECKIFLYIWSFKSFNYLRRLKPQGNRAFTNYVDKKRWVGGTKIPPHLSTVTSGLTYILLWPQNENEMKK